MAGWLGGWVVAGFGCMNQQLDILFFQMNISSTSGWSGTNDENILRTSKV